MTPHVHVTLIKAWADGAQIQLLPLSMNPGGLWVDCADPSWMPDRNYRIKPGSIQYRVYMYDSAFGPQIVAITHAEYADDNPENSSQFTKWLGPWQGVTYYDY